jgi:hypothetical protein
VSRTWWRLDVGAYADPVARRRQKRKKAQEKEQPYHRRYGVIWRPGKLGVPREPGKGWIGSTWVNDGGEDAPLSPRGREMYVGVLLGIFVVFVVLAILTAHGF